jgi:putative membrane protein
MTQPPRRPGFADDPPRTGAQDTAVPGEGPRMPALLAAEEAGAVTPAWSPKALSAPRHGWGTLGLMAAGGAVLLGAWAAFGLAGMIAAQFAVSPLLGWLSSGAVAAGMGFIGAGLWREARGLASLARVDRLRAALSDPASPLEPTRAAALAWVTDVAARVPDAGRVVPAVTAAGTVTEIAAHLRAGVVAALAAEAGRIGRRAALEGGAIVALSPSPSLDAVIAGWRGLRVVREVAALHGLKPGHAAMRRLLARTVSIAATTAGADLIAQTAAEGLVGATPGLREIAGAVPGAGVTAFRLYRLSLATAAACAPVET